MRKSNETTYARHDVATCLAPALFRSLVKGERRRGKLDLVYEYGDGVKIEFRNFEPLGADDLRVLQGLVALAGAAKPMLLLEPDSSSDMGRELRANMEFQWDAVDARAVVVRSSYRALAAEIGYSQSEETRHLRECVERLWSVSIIVQNGKRREGFRLLSMYASKEGEGDGELCVALNPLLAQSVMGGRHARVIMDEVRALDSDVARLIHQRLCGWIDPGKSGAVTMATLAGYVWPDAATPAAARKRHQRVRSALVELGRLGWRVDEYERGKFRIVRPVPPKYRSQTPQISVTNPPNIGHTLKR